MLSDPSDVFGDGTTNTRDEVDGYIDANLDIPEINNEVKEQNLCLNSLPLPTLPCGS